MAIISDSERNFLGTCPLFVLGDEKNPDNELRDKNLTGLLMELVNNIWAVLQKNTERQQQKAGTEEEVGLYTTGNPSQLHYIHEAVGRTNRVLSSNTTRTA
jgi:hypothetical protein